MEIGSTANASNVAGYSKLAVILDGALTLKPVTTIADRTISASTRNLNGGQSDEGVKEGERNLREGAWFGYLVGALSGCQGKNPARNCW
jgi:hypothetical protein